MINLIGNAILHGCAPGDEVAISIEVDGSGDFLCRVEDPDRNPGADLAKLAADYLVSRKVGEGIGLGLAFCAVTASNHRGKISMERRAGMKETCLLLKSADQIPVES